MQKKKVLFVIDSLICGGAEKSIVSLIPLLDRNKYKISLWMRHPVGEFIPMIPKDVELVEQPKYMPFEMILLRTGKLFFSFMLRFNKILGRMEHPAETLYKCQGWAMKVPSGNWDVVFAYQQGLPTYLVANNFEGTIKLAWVNADIFKAGYNIKFNSRFYRNFDHICPVSNQLHSMMDEHMPEFSEKYTTVWDILNTELILKFSLEKAPKLKPSLDTLVFVTTGRLVPPKGYDIALEAAVELKQNGVKFKWYFIGEGSERNNIENTIIKNGLMNDVILLGTQLNPYKYMKQADVYVQTSKFEGFGITVCEAKALGLPIVSTNFDVINNQLTHEKNGLIADMNGKSVANNIYRMVTDANLRNSIIDKLKQENLSTYLTEVVKVEKMIDK